MLSYTFPHYAGIFICPYIEGRSDCAANYAQLKKAPLLKEYSLARLGAAWKEGIEIWRRFRHICSLGYRIDEALKLYKNPFPPPKENKHKVNIALIGYVYDLYDIFMGMDTAKRLENMNVNVKTFEMLKDEEINAQIKPMKKSLFWTFSNKVFGAGLHYYKDKNIDGVIHLTAFGCGPDALSGKMMELDSVFYAKPFLTVRVDEQSGENHLQTRIEAFVDMLIHKKNKE
jgi:predicted nucleotide-binding protein (sugar kinase/HSP70/actin superfamily)